MYKALKSVNERKQAFIRYIAEKKERDEKEASEKITQDRVLLFKLWKEAGIKSTDSYDGGGLILVWLTF